MKSTYLGKGKFEFSLIGINRRMLEILVRCEKLMITKREIYKKG